MKKWSLVIIFVIGCAPIYQITPTKEKIPEIKVLIGEKECTEIKSKNLTVKIDNKIYKTKKINTKEGKILIGKEKIDADKVEIYGTQLIIDDKPYRGKVLLYKKGKRFSIVNKLNIEDYLRGVVPCEISTKEYEAIKAQAILARSFALSKINNTKNYDVKATVEDQVYKGISAEKEITDKAVKETSGIVAMYENKIIQAQYHSTCGGRTKDGNLPYLKSKRCQFCQQSPHYKWEIEKPKEKIKEIKINERNSGRVEKITVITDEGEKIMSGEEFRNLFGLKSTYFDIQIKGDKIKITGHGYGHGIGLCQYGAIEMAKRGFDYKSIIKYYYNGVKIKKIY